MLGYFVLKWKTVALSHIYLGDYTTKPIFLASLFSARHSIAVRSHLPADVIFDADLSSLQAPNPQEAVVAETAAHPEDPGQVQGVLWHIRCRQAGARAAPRRTMSHLIKYAITWPAHVSREACSVVQGPPIFCNIVIYQHFMQARIVDRVSRNNQRAPLAITIDAADPKTWNPASHNSYK